MSINKIIRNRGDLSSDRKNSSCLEDSGDESEEEAAS